MNSRLFILVANSVASLQLSFCLCTVGFDRFSQTSIVYSDYLTRCLEIKVEAAGNWSVNYAGLGKHFIEYLHTRNLHGHVFRVSSVTYVTYLQPSNPFMWTSPLFSCKLFVFFDSRMNWLAFNQRLGSVWLHVCLLLITVSQKHLEVISLHLAQTWLRIWIWTDMHVNSASQLVRIDTKLRYSHFTIIWCSFTNQGTFYTYLYFLSLMFFSPYIYKISSMSFLSPSFVVQLKRTLPSGEEAQHSVIETPLRFGSVIVEQLKFRSINQAQD